MSDTLLQLQEKLASFLDSAVSAPSECSKAWQRRQSYINRAQRVWAEVDGINWRNLYKEYHALVSAPSGVSSHSLPNGTTHTLPAFRKMAGHVLLGGSKLTATDPFKKVDFTASSRYSYVLGTPTLYKLVVKWSNDSGSLVSLMVPYYFSPTSLTTPGAISPCPNPEYLVAKASAFELLSPNKEHPEGLKEDARAEIILQRMISAENVPSYGDERRIITEDEKRGFVWGRDG